MEQSRRTEAAMSPKRPTTAIYLYSQVSHWKVLQTSKFVPEPQGLFSCQQRFHMENNLTPVNKKNKVIVIAFLLPFISLCIMNIFLNVTF